jgi:hypothetical protein
MKASMRQVLSPVVLCIFLGLIAMSTVASAQDVTSSPSSLSFSNTYVGMVSGSKTITITNQLNGIAIIASVSFSCPQYGLASGVAPITLAVKGTITHYSIFFQPDAAATFNCNFVMSMWDGTTVNVPLSGTGLTTTAVTKVTPSSLSFPNQVIGTTSASQTITVTNSGGQSVNVTGITLSPPSFTIGPITLPFTIAKLGGTLSIPVFYTPGQVTSEIGAIDIAYNALPDNGSSLSGNGVAASSLVISSSTTLPQATQNAAYQATLAAAGGTGPYSWLLGAGSILPMGLSLSSTGVISGTLDPSVAAGNYTFTVQVTDSANGSTASALFTLGVYANLGDNCNDISFNVPGTSTLISALTDLGTGTYQGSQGGLYPNGSNVRPSSHDADGVAFAYGIQPLDANGNPSPSGKYVLLAIGESTAQNEFNRFLPIANADPAKNSNLVIVNGAQGGATPKLFASQSSYYWGMVLNNYLPQNHVTANQVVAIWLEDTDGIATGTFPSDITTLQSEYESMMQAMHNLFPNLKLVYFSSRVYAGYSNGVGKPDNPEPYAYEVGFAVKWAIQDQLNGASNLNYNPNNGPVVAPWMAWGPYYWSNGMLGRNDGFVWDCADFSADGTHPSSTFGQLKVAVPLLTFLKTDNTTIPWYLAPKLGLTATAGNNQTGGTGSVLPTALSVLASNLNGGAPSPGVSVAFSDNGAGGSFGTPVATTDSSGIASTTYTLPTTAQTVNISATSSGFTSASFTETAAVLALTSTGGNNQSGGTGTVLPTALTVLATSNGNPVPGISVTFNDGGAGGSFGSPVATTDSNGIASTTYTLPATAQTVSISATSAGYPAAAFTETAIVLSLTPTAGNNQSGGVGTTLPTALAVLASSNGSPVAGLSVTFSDGGAGGSFGSPVATTDSNGTASTTYTLPATAKTVNISATHSGYTPASFTETATVLALTATAGNNQTGGTGTVLPTALTVLASSNGNPVAGVSVTFSDGGAGGSFGTPVAITGSNGTASTTYTLPSTAKTVTISATSSGYTSATFTETAAQLVATLTVVSGGKQIGTVGTTLPLPIVLKAKDSLGKVVVGASIAFSDAGLGGTFSPNPAITGSNGQASTTYTLPTVAKSITVTGSNGSVSVRVTEQAVPGPATAINIIQGNNQTAHPNNKLAKALIVSVTDQYGNGISGLTVNFTDNGAGGTFSTTTPITNAAGKATVIYTTPAQTGTVTITASYSSLTPVNFTETVQ